ncbi:MAG: hypothetical protein Q9O62_08485 [Ardenticatenia bacterium]|nr:hypothetical protein [Ardenticatenia bacterium]
MKGSSRRPAWLAGEWERIRLHEGRAREIAFRFAAARARRFRLKADEEADLSPWLAPLRPLADEERWFQGVEPDQPWAQRVGCGCLGLLLKPLVWADIVRPVPTVWMAGRFEPGMAELLGKWLQAGAGLRELHLLADDGPVWQHWDYGTSWVVHLTPAEFTALARELHSALGSEVELAWIEEEEEEKGERPARPN